MVDIKYQVKLIDSNNWQEPVKNGEIAGTCGQSRPLEALRIVDMNTPGLGIVGYALVSDMGWSGANIQGQDIGSTGLGRHIEAIKLGLFGEKANDYTIWYRCHVQDIGFMDWVRNGELSGTENGNKQIEAIQIVLCRNDENVWLASNTTEPYRFIERPKPQVNTSSILDIARGHLGYLSYSEDDSAFGRRLVGEMAGNWCCYFCVCCALDAGLSVPVTGYCPTMMDWAKQTGRFTGSPQPGYFVLYDWDGNGVPNHIGIVEEVYSSNHILAIEGNTGDPVGVYRKDRDYGILGFVNPF